MAKKTRRVKRPEIHIPEYVGEIDAFIIFNCVSCHHRNHIPVDVVLGCLAAFVEEGDCEVLPLPTQLKKMVYGGGTNQPVN